MLPKKINYVTGRNERVLPVILPLSSVCAGLPPYIPEGKITAVDNPIRPGDLTVIQYEDDNGGGWCYLNANGGWHYPVHIRIKHDEKARAENMRRRIEIEGYKAKKREAKKPRKGFFC